MQPNDRYSETHDYSDPHASRPSFDIQAAIILILAVIVVSLAMRLNLTAGVYADVSTAPISTPALPPPAPIYYAPPVATLMPVMPQRIDNSDQDNSDHRICILVVDCSQADRSN